MKREILFRGKRADNGELVISDSLMQVKGQNPRLWVEFDGWVEVIPETVGQFTGLTDKNGKKIFDSDVLKIISSVQGEIMDNTRAFQSVKREDCAVVLWDYKTGGYKLKVYHKGKYKRIANFAIGHLRVYNAEVIGNIYDNPELLGGQTA